MCQKLIRAHHLLCMQFFEGKGYSKEFVEHTYKQLEELTDDTEVKIVKGSVY